MATLKLKLVNRGRVLLGSNEVEDIRMVHPQHAHIGPAAFASLFDGLQWLPSKHWRAKGKEGP